MKKTISMLTLTLAASAFSVFAQESPSPTPALPPPQHEGGWHGRGGPGGPGGPMREALESLTPAERKQLMEARKKAMEAPEVVEARQKEEAARKAMREAVKAATLKADPTLGPVLDKLEAAMKANKPHPPIEE